MGGMPLAMPTSLVSCELQAVARAPSKPTDRHTHALFPEEQLKTLRHYLNESVELVATIVWR